MKQGEQIPHDISYLGEVGGLSTCAGKAEKYSDKRSHSTALFENTVPNPHAPVCTRISPETLCEAEANGGVQLQVEQLLGYVLDPIACVVKLRTGSVSIYPLMIDLGARCKQVRM